MLIHIFLFIINFSLTVIYRRDFFTIFDETDFRKLIIIHCVEKPLLETIIYHSVFNISYVISNSYSVGFIFCFILALTLSYYDMKNANFRDFLTGSILYVNLRMLLLYIPFYFSFLTQLIFYFLVIIIINRRKLEIDKILF